MHTIIEPAGADSVLMLVDRYVMLASVDKQLMGNTCYLGNLHVFKL